MTIKTTINIDEETKKIDPSQILKIVKECSEVVIRKKQYDIIITKDTEKEQADGTNLYKIKILIADSSNLKYKIDDSESILEKDLMSFIYVLTSFVYIGETDFS